MVLIGSAQADRAPFEGLVAEVRRLLLELGRRWDEGSGSS
jgi:hypothetical protein